MYPYYFAIYLCVSMNRGDLTKKLQRMIGSIEAGKTPALVKELFVFGSYARGALQPNDLDLVVIHDPPSAKLMEELKQQANAKAKTPRDFLYGAQLRFLTLMRSSLRRAGERIDIVLGCALEQALGPRRIPRDELRLLWSAADRDWQSKVAAIGVDLHAGTAPRSEFIAPKYAGASLSDVAYVTSLIQQRRLRLTRIPIESLSVLDEPTPSAPFEEYLLRSWGVKARAHYPYAKAWLRIQKIKKPIITARCELFDDQYYYRVQLGRLHLRKMVSHFQRAALRKQCLIPFFRKGQPANYSCLSEVSPGSQPRGAETRREWVPGFDPERFSADEATERMQEKT
jgi:predicted nucleotidyltransferase